MSETKLDHVGAGKVYLTCAETAKLVRKALKAAFPDTKFSVRSHTYSGGASIDVSYMDGPTSAEVEKVTRYDGGDFDGMIDMKFNKDHWLMPDGSVQIAYSPGTEGQRGSVPGIITDPPSPDAKLVSLGADYVFVHRSVSDEWRNEVIEEFEQVLGRPLPRKEGCDTGWWNLQVPLKVDYHDGRLLHMVESDTTYLSEVFNAYTSCRSRSGEVVVR